MSKISYPFISFKQGDIARPYLPIALSNPSTGLEVETYALIDTGADECAFPARFAAILGHDFSAGERKQIQTGNGVTLAYSHTSIIALDEFATEQITVDYLVNLETPLLGVQSFLSHFVVTLDYPKQIVTLEI